MTDHIKRMGGGGGGRDRVEESERERVKEREREASVCLGSLESMILSQMSFG